jgi:hypothetical protein
MTQKDQSPMSFDLMPEIKTIVRDAIKDRLIQSEDIKTFDEKVRTLKGADLEEYLQNLWDDL